jgi:hypothetical protein
MDRLRPDRSSSGRLWCRIGNDMVYMARRHDQQQGGSYYPTQVEVTSIPLGP